MLIFLLQKRGRKIGINTIGLPPIFHFFLFFLLIKSALFSLTPCSPYLSFRLGAVRLALFSRLGARSSSPADAKKPIGKADVRVIHSPEIK